MSDNQITGKATVRQDGTELLTDGDAKINLGGIKRTPVNGGDGKTRYKEEFVEPSIEITGQHNAKVSISKLNAINAATVIVETDTGVTFIATNAFTTDTVGINTKDGTYDLKMSAESVDEVLP